jgi:DNA-binding MarR family transcriptional regulator/GNAT superfamily N-acetyltransferase
MISQVRRFNRVVTQRVGALDDHYLARDRPLGECRVLWEIGDDGCDVRRLRSRLDLDSGYLSRLLRALEADGLVSVAASEDDRRVRTARLTAVGRVERGELDVRSDELATSMLAPLSDHQRQCLVTAMAEVERLLTSALVRIDQLDPGHHHAQHCLGEYFAELDQRFDTGFDPARSRLAGLDDLRPPGGLFLVATLHDEPVGCGGLKLHADRPPEIKRMWVEPRARGLGVGRRLLTALEEQARARGQDAVRLDTNRTLREAIAMYQSAGYREIAAFNDEVYAHHWFEKQLVLSRT